MAGKANRGLRGIAAPVFAGEPLLVRLCSAFVDNLATILRGALIGGALLLVSEFDSLMDRLDRPEPDAKPTVAETAVDVAPPDAPAPIEPVVNDRVLHYLNCTYEEYRARNYAECVDEPSGIYRAPEAGPDDTGSLSRQLPVRFARVGGFEAPVRTKRGT